MQMVKTLKAIALTALVLCFAAPAFAATQMSDTVKLFYQAFSSNQPELLDQVLAPEWEDIPLNPGQGAGRDAFKPMIAGFNQIFQNLKITNEDIIESGDITASE
jgi:SnoaL-like domain